MHATREVAETPLELTVANSELEGLPLDFPVTPGDVEAWTRVHEIAMRRMDQMLSLEPKILRTQDPGSIHDFRVASRRAQQALDLLYPSPRPAPIRRIRKKIRRARRAFSEVRNCDVLVESLEKRLARKRVANREAWQAVHEYVSDRRSSARAKALRRLAHLGLSKAYIRLQGLKPDSIQTPQDETESSRLAPFPSDGAFRSRLARELGSKWLRFASALNEGQRRHGNLSLHAARIAGKRLRYLAEILQDLHWPGARATIDWLRTLQQVLGDWHDLDVTEQMMTEMLARPAFLRERLEIASAVIRLIGLNRRNKERFRVQFAGLGLESKGGKWAQEWVQHALAEGAAN